MAFCVRLLSKQYSTNINGKTWGRKYISDLYHHLFLPAFKISYFGSCLVAQWVKHPPLSRLWLWLLLLCGFDPWPRNFHMPRAWPNIYLSCCQLVELTREKVVSSCHLFLKPIPQSQCCSHLPISLRFFSTHPYSVSCHIMFWSCGHIFPLWKYA